MSSKSWLVAVAGLVTAVAAGVAVSPLGGALSRTMGGFSDWLTGTPGTPAPSTEQRAFEKANRFPGEPRLRRLVRVDRDGRTFLLYGFETRQVVCLRVAVRAFKGAGPQAACVSRADLRRSGDLVLPVKANLGVGHEGPLPREAGDPPTVPKYLLTFGVAAAEVTRVTVKADTGATPAVVRNGAFLHVLEPSRGVWARSITATSRSGRKDSVGIGVYVSGEPPLRTGLKPHGPATVERKLNGGTIGWFDRREARGISAHDAGLGRGSNCCRGFVRVIYPDPDDFLGMAIGDKTLMPRIPGVPGFGSIDDPICYGVITRGGSGTGCGSKRTLFSRSPLNIRWGFSGAGQQFWLVSGLASDDVARIEVYLGTGQHWRAPLRDNATAFRIPRAKFPVRIVGYDEAGRAIAVWTIRDN